jgi:hypothetical protein
MDNIADAVDEVNEPGCHRHKSVEDDLDETDQPAEIHVVTEEIIDEKTGKKVGVRTTKTIKSAEQSPGNLTLMLDNYTIFRANSNRRPAQNVGIQSVATQERTRRYTDSTHKIQIKVQISFTNSVRQCATRRQNSKCSKNRSRRNLRRAS